MFNPRDTIVRHIDPQAPDLAVIAEAADLLRRGKLVAFPTETVYGLGASALDESAVRSIFAAKGRPPNNPIIVHVADALAAQLLALNWPEQAAKLAERFWPGSLTLVLPKQPMVPDIVSAGSPTVGLRVPAHPVALALLQVADIPIAAPSANRSSQVSPTTADHVLRGLSGCLDMLLDAGPTSGGLESTVLDLTVDAPRLLRPGLVTVAEIEEVIGPIDVGVEPRGRANQLKSPGMLERHYAPRARLICIAPEDDVALRQALESVHQAGWLKLRTNSSLPVESNRLKIISMPSEVSQYSARLYAALHELDDADVELIVADLPPQSRDWLAVHDRLRRASHAGS